MFVFIARSAARVERRTAFLQRTGRRVWIPVMDFGPSRMQNGVEEMEEMQFGTEVLILRACPPTCPIINALRVEE